MSQTVDSKVIEMSFDNSNFERNVRNSLQTIDKLKNSLNFNNLNLNKMNIDATPVARSFEVVEKSIDAVQNKFSTLGIMGITVIANLTNTVVNYAKKAVSFLTGSVVQGGIRRAMNIENARFQLHGLLNDLEQEQLILDNVNEAVKGTAYGYDSAASAAAQFAASGIRGGNEMYKYLRGIAGVAAMTNSTYEDIAQIFTRVAGQGRVMANDLNSLASRGINAAAVIANLKGITEEELRDLVSKGQLSFSEFASMMDDAFGEHAKKANETFTGSISNIKAALARVGALFVEPIIKQNSPFVQLFNEIRKQIDVIKEEIGPLATSVTGFFNGVASSLTEIVKNFSLPDFLSTISKKIKNLKIDGEKLKGTFDGFGAVIDIFISSLRRGFSYFDQIFSSEGFSKIINGFLGITSSISGFLRKIADELAPEKAMSIFGVIIQGFSDFIVGVSDLFSGFKDVFAGIKDVISGTVTSIAEAFKSVLSWIKTNTTPVDLITAIAALDLAAVFAKVADVANKLRDITETVYKILSGEGGGILTMIFGKEPEETAKKFKKALDTIGESLTGFLSKLTAGVKIGSLVAIALALGLMTAALTKLADLNADDLVVGVTGLSIVSGILVIVFNRLTKSLSLVNNFKIIQVGIMLSLLASAINILAVSVQKFGEMDLPTLAKGITAMSIALIALSKSIEIMGKGSGLKVINLVAILAFAEACNILADAVKKMGELSMTDMTRGFIGTIGTVYVLIKMLEEIGEEASKPKILIGVVSLKMLVSSLDEIADVLGQIGSMSWSSMTRGLVGMGAALAELTAVLYVFGNFIEKSISMLVGSFAIRMITSVLDELAEGFMHFAMLSWGQITNGIYAMGVALTEVGTVIGLLGSLAKGWSLLGAASLSIAVKSLSELASSFVIFSTIPWSSVGSGLVAMGGALAELSLTIGILGKVAPLSGIIGGIALRIAVSSLTDLAKSLSIFGEMSWDQIINGVYAMGVALTEISVAVGLLGKLGGFWSIIGSFSISIVTESLIDLATAFQKFGEMDLEKSGQAVIAMMDALGALAAGSFINILSGFGASSISKIAIPIGLLAESIKKWEGVTIADNFVGDMTELASGIAAFWNEWGAMAGSGTVVNIAEPIGTLADSLRKWEGLAIPDNIKDNLTSLADGISSFMWSGFGAGVIEDIAEPIGVLADSMNKWGNVSVPENLAQSLKQIADSIFNLSFTFIGGLSLDTIAGPIGVLADSISKWNDVELPDDLGEKLSNFFENFQYAGSLLTGFKISNIAEPIGALAEAIGKWQGLEIPLDLGDSLNSFASDIETFASDLTVAINSDYSKIGSFANSLTKLEEAVNNVVYVDMEKINSFVSGVSGLAEGLNLDVESFSGLAGDLANSINNLVDTILGGIDSRLEDLRLKGQAVIDALNEGLDDFSSTFDLINRNMEEMVNIINSYESQFESAGANVALGLKRGIDNYAPLAIESARSMAASAAAAARIELDEHSPSRIFQKIGEFIPRGMALGIDSLSSVVVDSVKDMASSAISGTQKAISDLSDFVQNDIDVNPTIRPVLDLSDVRSGAGIISDIFADNPIFGANMDVNTISRMMNSRDQKTTNLDVVNAINNLRRDIDANPRNSYTINGITYDDGSGLSDAFETIIRYARVERRA